MFTRTTYINGVEVVITGNISNEEVAIYFAQVQARHKFKIINAHITVDGDFIDFGFRLELVPFERIRRITGYLVGSTNRWNNAKRSEEKDRVKHK